MEGFPYFRQQFQFFSLLDVFYVFTRICANICVTNSVLLKICKFLCHLYNYHIYVNIYLINHKKFQKYFRSVMISANSCRNLKRNYARGQICRDIGCGMGSLLKQKVKTRQYTYICNIPIVKPLAFEWLFLYDILWAELWYLAFVKL